MLFKIWIWINLWLIIFSWWQELLGWEQVVRNHRIIFAFLFLLFLDLLRLKSLSSYLLIKILSQIWFYFGFEQCGNKGWRIPLLETKMQVHCSLNHCILCVLRVCLCGFYLATVCYTHMKRITRDVTSFATCAENFWVMDIWVKNIQHFLTCLNNNCLKRGKKNLDWVLVGISSVI